jgi:ribosome-binding factor A
MNEPEGRMTRVDKLLYQSLAEILRVRYPKETLAITLTGVKCSPDLFNAHVSYSVMNDDKKSAVDFFRKNAREIGRAMAKDVALKRHPKLHFIYDESIKNMASVDRLLHEMMDTHELPPIEMETKKKQI